MPHVASSPPPVRETRESPCAGRAPRRVRFAVGGPMTVDALETAGEHLAATHVRCVLSRPDTPTELRSDITRTTFGDLALVDASVSPIRVSRDSPADSRTTDVFGVQLVVRGAERVGRGPGSSVVEAGQVIVWDASRPIEAEVLRPMRKRTLVIPGERARTFFPGIDAVVGRPIPAQVASVRVLSSFLDTLAGHLPDLDEAGGDAAARATYELLRGVLAPMSPAPDAALRLRIVAYIEHHLGDPGLTPPRIAHAHAISIRRLHAVFRGQESVAARIRRSRLERCRQDLEAASCRSVTEVAYRWGYRNAGHFSTAFRREFDRSPSSVLRASTDAERRRRASASPADRREG